MKTMIDANGKTIDMYRSDVRSMCLAPDGERVAVVGRLYPDARKRRFVWAVRYQVAPGLANESNLDGGSKFVAHERASYAMGRVAS